MNNWVLNEGERLDDLVRGDMKIIQLPIWEPVRELLRSCFLHLAVKILLRLKLIR